MEFKTQRSKPKQGGSGRLLIVWKATIYIMKLTDYSVQKEKLVDLLDNG